MNELKADRRYASNGHNGYYAVDEYFGKGVVQTLRVGMEKSDAEALATLSSLN